MNITIGGDLCITPPFVFNNLFDKSIVEIFEKSDYNIVNLECPVTQAVDKNKIVKTGPHLRTDAAIFEKLKELNVHAVSLANNHILDYGEKGLKHTLDGCIKNGIEIVGAGMNLTEASKSLIIEKNNKKIAFVNFCENEWSVASTGSGGANPMDTIDNLAQIENAKQHADYVIVIVHGGHEYYHLPSPRMVKLYRFYTENGADAVIGHHTHCISGYELYQNVPIAYSLGNMLFTLDSQYTRWYTGLIAQLHINKGNPIKLELLPIRQTPQTFILNELHNAEKENILTQVKLFSKIINNPSELENEWAKFVEIKSKTINIFSPVNALPGKYIRAGLNCLGINRLFLKEKNLTQILNYIRCEAHRDLIIETMKKIKINENSHT